MNFFSVGIFSVIGAIVRYGIGLLFVRPIPTLVVNLVGCFILGWFTGWIKNKKHPNWLIVGIGSGFIGSFTTFSTFSVDNVELIKNGLLFESAIYLFLSLFGGLLLAHIGLKLERKTKHE